MCDCINFSEFPKGKESKMNLKDLLDDTTCHNTPEYLKEEEKYREISYPDLKLEESSSTNLKIKINLRKSISVNNNLDIPIKNSQGNNSDLPKINFGRWNKNEKALFLKCIFENGLNWRVLEDCVRTRTSIQLKSHGQKVFDRIKMKFHTDNPVEFIKKYPSKFNIDPTEQVGKYGESNSENKETEQFREPEGKYKIDNLDYQSFRKEDERNPEINEAAGQLNDLFCTEFEERETMILINHFLNSILQDIKEKEGGIDLIIYLFALNMKAMEKLRCASTSKKMNKFLRRLIRVVKQQVDQLDKYFKDLKKKSELIQNYSIILTEKCSKLDSKNSAFGIINPIKVWKFRTFFLGTAN